MGPTFPNTSARKLLLLVLIFHFRSATSEYVCLCYYAHEAYVHQAPTLTSVSFGVLRMLDCKPLYQGLALNPNFLTVQFKGKIGYVHNDGLAQIQSCLGDPLPSDLVITTTTSASTTKSTPTTHNHHTTKVPTTIPTTRHHNIHTTTKPTTSSTTPRPTTTTTTTTLKPTHSPTDCAHGWVKFKSSCYLFKTDTRDFMTWQEAKTFCSGQHSQLVAIGSPEEQNFVHQHVQFSNHETHVNTHDFVWIGANDENSAGNYLWQDSGTHVFSYINSELGPPDKHNRHCVATSRHHQHDQWHARDCGDHLGFICERAPPYHCERGWVSMGDTCYLFNLHDHLTWHQANMKCGEQGARLVFIESHSEQDTIRQYLHHEVGHVTDEKESSLWIGATDQSQEDNWVWRDAGNHDYSTTTFTGWSPGEPNNHYDDDEDCAAVRGTHSYHWNDYPCSFRLHFICEKQPTPTV